MAEESKKFTYDGPVFIFNTCVQEKWTASTYAPNKSRAVSNLSYQFKKANGLVPNSAVHLPGQIKEG